MRSLTAKLILAFLLVSLVGTVLLALIAGRTTASEFRSFVFDQEQEALVDLLAAYYERTGTWSGVETVLPTGTAATGMRRGGAMAGPGPRGHGPNGSGFALADASRRVILGGMGYRPGSSVPPAILAGGQAIEVNGHVVGTLLQARDMATAPPAAVAFLRRVNGALGVAAVGATAAALLVGVLLAHTLGRPLRELTAATRAIAQGKLGHTVPVHSQDELGTLATAFNQMSQDLAYARERRRRLTADIAHDLRTPIAIIQGHAEALRDGVLPATPDTFSLIHDEAQRLNRLVEDLRTLAQADTGELSLVPRPVQIDAWLQHIAAAHRPRARQQDVTLQLEIAPGLPQLTIDPGRMAQVVGNLLDNALRHAPAGSQVTLAADREGANVYLRVCDAGPGIAPEDLPHVFERFYRGDKSRRRHEGGSGLGLAIARSIVTQHGGRIWAESEPGHGATFIVALPH